MASFGAALYCGIVIGAIYDIFSMLRKPFANPWIIGVMDIAYYALAAVLAAGAMLYINCGTFRLYIYIAMGMGILLYRRFPGRLLKLGMEKFTKKLLRRER